MHEKKFDPQNIECLDRPELYQNMNFDNLILQLEISSIQTIADIGSGTGFFSIPFAEKAEKVHAVDISQEMLDYLSKKLDSQKINNIEIVLSTEEEINVPDEFIDLAWMSSVFHELDGSGTLDEVMRILKPGGRFAIMDFKKIHEEDGPPYGHRIAKPDAIGTCINAGFNFVREFETGSKSKYGLIFRK